MRRGLTTALAGLLVVVGCLMVPVAATAWWTKATVTDSDTFVSTVAPVAADPTVQARAEQQIVDQVMGWVDDQQIVERSVDALAAQGAPPRVAAALRLLAEPLRDRLERRVQQVATRVVESEEFQTAFEESLRSVHEQLVTIVEGKADDTDLLSAGADGTVRGGQTGQSGRLLCALVGLGAHRAGCARHLVPDRRHQPGITSESVLEGRGVWAL